MNILFLSLTFPDQHSPERGTYNLDLCRALARQHRVQAIAPRGWHERLAGDGDRRLRPSPAAVRCGLSVHYPTFWYLPKLKPETTGTALWWSVRPTVKRIERTFRPDAVISYWAFPDGAGALQVARHFGVPSLVIVGGSDVLLLPHEPGRGPGVRNVLRQSSAIVTVSDGLRRASIALGADPDRVRTIRQGVDPEVFHPADKRASRRALDLPDAAEILLWVGRMVRVKNLDLLLAAFGRIAESRPHARLYLLGDGELRSALEDRTRQDPRLDRVRIVGPVSHDVLPDWYRAADVTVLTSTSEGLPNVLRESLACGTPFVSTDVGDVREIAMSSIARLVPSGDADEFAAAVADVLQSDARSAAAGYKARTWAACADEFSALIDELRMSKAMAGARA